MTLIPAKGISSRRFAAWMNQQNINTINDLMEMGFIHPKNNREILLHPMIREVAVEELKPSVRNCSVLLDSLQEISLMHGLEFTNNKQVFILSKVSSQRSGKTILPIICCSWRMCSSIWTNTAMNPVCRRSLRK